MRLLFAIVLALATMKIAADANPWRTTVHMPTTDEFIMGLVMLLVLYQAFHLVLGVFITR